MGLVCRAAGSSASFCCCRFLLSATAATPVSDTGDMLVCGSLGGETSFEGRVADDLGVCGLLIRAGKGSVLVARVVVAMSQRSH